MKRNAGTDGYEDMVLWHRNWMGIVLIRFHLLRCGATGIMKIQAHMGFL